MMPYIPAWLVMGATLTENVRLRSVMEKHLLSFQDKKSGGFFATAAGRDSGHGLLDFDSTTQACAALCIAGNEAAAAKCGHYLRKLVETQPNPTSRLFLQMDSEKGLIREFDPKQAFSHVLAYAEPKAHLYKIGLLARAFAFLHPLTGDKSYLELAESHYRRAADLSPDIWTNTLAHKMGWAAWTLFRMTGRPTYVEDARRMADHLVTLQQPDGGFSYPELWASYEDVPMDFKLNIGTQFATWIIYARAMAGRA
jgi:hypothetical protein